jgi:hypothetical protein
LIQLFCKSSFITQADPIPPSDGTVQNLEKPSSSVNNPNNRLGIPTIMEYRASTIPKTHLIHGEDPCNLTFVDTPGFGSFLDASLVMAPVSEYCLAQFVKTDKVIFLLKVFFVRDYLFFFGLKVFRKGIEVPQLSKFLNGGSGCHTHVDVVIYCILVCTHFFFQYFQKE